MNELTKDDCGIIANGYGIGWNEVAEIVAQADAIRNGNRRATLPSGQASLNRTQIIEMAKASGMYIAMRAEDDVPELWSGPCTPDLERFAALARATLPDDPEPTQAERNQRARTIVDNLARATLPAAQPVSVPDAEMLSFNAQRLRYVSALCGLANAVPQDDAELDRVRGAVLGAIALHLRIRGAASGASPDILPEGWRLETERESLIYSMGVNAGARTSHTPKCGDTKYEILAYQDEGAEPVILLDDQAGAGSVGDDGRAE